MAGVTLSTLYLHDAADLSDYMVLNVSDINETPSSSAIVRAYANGRLRLVTTPELRDELSLRLILVSRADREALSAWRRTLLLLRDPLGHVMHGMYPDLDIAPVCGEDESTISLVFQFIDDDVSV
jgi:hypothetical protein